MLLPVPRVSVVSVIGFALQAVGLFALHERCLCMLGDSRLSTSEFASLAEVGKGFSHGCIPVADGVKLLEMRLIYKLLGENRLTMAGRTRLAQGI
jgi:hypothetical protein